MTERIAWQTNQNTLGILTVDWHHQVTSYQNPLAYGTIAPGMLFSGNEEKTFVGPADIDMPSQAEAVLQFYADNQCQTPLA